MGSETLKYQNPGLLAFAQDFMFRGHESFGAANPGFFSTLTDGLLALVVTIVSIFIIHVGC